MRQLLLNLLEDLERNMNKPPDNEQGSILPRNRCPRHYPGLLFRRISDIDASLLLLLEVRDRKLERKTFRAQFEVPGVVMVSSQLVQVSKQLLTLSISSWSGSSAAIIPSGLCSV